MTVATRADYLAAQLAAYWVVLWADEKAGLWVEHWVQSTAAGLAALKEPLLAGKTVADLDLMWVADLAGKLVCGLVGSKVGKKVGSMAVT